MYLTDLSFVIEEELFKSQGFFVYGLVVYGIQGLSSIGCQTSPGLIVISNLKLDIYSIKTNPSLPDILSSSAIVRLPI